MSIVPKIKLFDAKVIDVDTSKAETLGPATHTYTVTIPDDVNLILVRYAREERQKVETIIAESVRLHLGLG